MISPIPSPAPYRAPWLRAGALAAVVTVFCATCAAAGPRRITLPLDDHSAGGFSHPIAQYTPDPAYTEKARRAGISGSVVLRILIGPDGCAHHIHLLRRLGWGLDQAAVRAVRAWRFRRPSGAGMGVPARIELSFSPDMPSNATNDLTPCTEARF